jgi:hypothetical protein
MCKPNLARGKARTSTKKLLEHLRVKSLSGKKVQQYFSVTRKEQENFSIQEEETKNNFKNPTNNQ